RSPRRRLRRSSPPPPVLRHRPDRLSRPLALLAPGAPRTLRQSPMLRRLRIATVPTTWPAAPSLSRATITSRRNLSPDTNQTLSNELPEDHSVAAVPGLVGLKISSEHEELTPRQIR